MKYFLLYLLFLCAVIINAQEDNLKLEVQNLIKGLGSEDYTIRLESFKKLTALKIRAYPFLKQELKINNELEVTEAINKILKNLVEYKNPDYCGKPIPIKGQTKADLNYAFCEWFSQKNTTAYLKASPNTQENNIFKEFFYLSLKSKIMGLNENEKLKFKQISNPLINNTNDTLILAHLAINLEVLGINENIKLKFQKSLDEITKYPSLIQVFILLRAHEIFINEKSIEEKEKLTKNMIIAFQDSINSNSYETENEQNILVLYNQLWKNLNIQQKEFFNSNITSNKPNIPWFISYANARYHLDLADFYRHKNTMEFYKKKDQENELAKTALIKGYELNPKIPDFCIPLIWLEWEKPASARLWLDRALALLVDADCIGNLINVMFFNGELKEALNLGNELLLTGDYDSFAFNYYPELVSKYFRIILTNTSGSLQVDSDQTIFQNLIFVYENSSKMKNNQRLINLLIGFSFLHSDWKNLAKYRSLLKEKIDLSQLELKGNEEEVEYIYKGYLEIKENNQFKIALDAYQKFEYKAALPIFLELHKTCKGFARFFILQILLKFNYTQNESINTALYHFYEEIGYKELAKQKIFQLLQSNVPEIKLVGQKMFNLLSLFDQNVYSLLNENRDFKIDSKDNILKKIEEIGSNNAETNSEIILHAKIYALQLAYVDDSSYTAFKNDFHKLFASTKKPGYLLNLTRIHNETNITRLKIHHGLPFEALFWNKTKAADRAFADQKVFINKALNLAADDYDKQLIDLLNAHGSINGRLKLAQEFFKIEQNYWGAILETESLKWHYCLNRTINSGWSFYQTMAQLLLLTGYEKTCLYYADKYCKTGEGVDSGWYLAGYIYFLNGEYDKAISALENGIGKKKDAGTFFLGENQISGTANLKNYIIDKLKGSGKYNENNLKILDDLKLK